MARTSEIVRPGDLITASLMNRIFSEVSSLEERVTALEAQGSLGVVITGFVPSGQIRVGQEVQILGRNFEVPASLNTLTIDSIPVVRFNPGSSDTVLMFNVPPAIPGLPKEAVVTVKNQFGTDSSSLTILPEQVIPKGRLVITDKTGTLGPITVGGLYTFWFELDSQTTVAETYQLEARYSDVVGGANTDAWRSNTILVDQAGQPLTTVFLRVDPTQPARVGLRVKVPDGATSASLVLRAKSLNNDAELSRSSSSISIVVGSAPPMNDPRVSVTLRAFGTASKGRVTNVDGVDTIEIPYGGSARISVFAEFSVEGTFEYTATVEPAAAGIWSLENLSPTGGEKGADSSEIIGVNAKLLSEASAAVAHAEQRSFVLRVSRTDNDQTGRFSSWLKMPIRGYSSA